MLPWKTAPAYASGLLKSVKLGRAAPSRGREDLDRAGNRKEREMLHRTTPETGRTHLRARRACDEVKVPNVTLSRSLERISGYQPATCHARATENLGAKRPAVGTDDLNFAEPRDDKGNST